MALFDRFRRKPEEERRMDGGLGSARPTAFDGEPEQIFLKDLETDYYRLQFLVETGSEMLKKEMEI